MCTEGEATVIIDDDPPSESQNEEIVIQLSDVQLYHRDLDLLCSNGQWLNDNVVNAGQVLIKRKYPSVCGLQDVIFSRTLAFQPETEQFVQVLNCRDSHWICASNIGCKPNVVKIYDSMRTGDVSTSTKEDIATLLQSTGKRIYLLFPGVQQQRDGSSCGVFALAFAQTLSEGKDPAKVVYPEEAKMRSHLLECISKKEISPFYTRAALDNPSLPFKSIYQIYCSCRLPDRCDDMVLLIVVMIWYSVKDAVNGITSPVLA